MNKKALLRHTGMTVEDVELVYEPSKEKMLALAAQQHRQHANPAPLPSHTLLVITLHWLRRKPTYEEMAQLYPHGVHFWHVTVRKVIDILDECIYNRFVTPLASNAPTAVFFVDTTLVPLPKTKFIPADYHKKSPTKAAWKYEI